MCGFIGKVSFDEINSQEVLNCNNLIECRGPDEKKQLTGNSSDNFKSNIDFNFSLIFNRLSIIDLSGSASQPMISKQFNSLILFNGEIFNHQDLRRDLEKKNINFFTDHSDTEVLLNGLSYYGLEFLNKVIGQFAIVFFDFNKNNVYLIRDRLGQKPLFYKSLPDSFSFSSNLKSLIALNKDKSIDETSLFTYLDLGVVPSPKTIIKDLYKVKPGEIIKFEFQNNKFKKTNIQYWNIEEFVSEEKFDSTKFFDLFNDSVNSRLVSDVPVANFLSGGIDSSSLVKSLNDNGQSINTFSVAYDDERYDETIWSSKVVQRYKTNHLSEKILIEEVSDYIDESIEIFDEPYSDPSTLPSFMLSKLISKKYKVAISGDGGDELLGGYLRTNLSLNNKKLKFNLSEKSFDIYNPIFGTGSKILSRSENIETRYRSFFHDKKLLNLLKIDHTNQEFKSVFYNQISDYKKLMLFEYKLYLSEMMMLKVDRTSMANSLEVRSPFVDHRLVQYILSTSPSYYDTNNSKAILKNYLADDFESEFINRKKMGFVFNLEKWTFSNINRIKNEFEKLNTYNISKSTINKLSIVKSRINAQRIWRLYFIEKYLRSLDNLI